MSATSTTTNLGLPQFASSDIPTWDDINSAFLALDTFISSVAPKFSTATSYQKGDVVLYNGGLYKFNANHAAGAWSGSDADAFKISDGLESTDMTGVVKYTAGGTGITANQYAHLTVVS